MGGGGWEQGLSVSSGPSDSSLWADDGASGVVPAVEAVPELAAGRRDHRDRRGRRGRAGGGVGAGTGAAPGS